MTIRTTSAPPAIAVVGCGKWGRHHVRVFADLGALAAIVDADAAVAKAMGAQHGVPAREWESVLGDPDIDAVVIAAPAEAHGSLAIAALSSGKHVLVEKPLALTLAEAADVSAAAARNDRILMVGHLMRYHPAYLRLKELVQAGDLGRLQYLYSNRLNLGTFRQAENALWSFAPHDISMILDLVGTDPSDVQAEGASYLQGVIADVTTTHLAFPGGERAHVFVSWLHPFKEQKLVVVGSEGMAVFNDGVPWNQKLEIYPHRIGWTNGLPSPEKAEAVAVQIDEREPLRAECEHFIECLRSGQTPRTDGDEGIRVLRVLELAEKSMSRSHDAFQMRFPQGRIHSSSVIDDDVEIGPDTAIWHFSHILPGTRIGAGVVIGQNASIGPDVAIGDNCKIQNNVSVYKGVTLEQGVFCGPSCVFTNVNTPRAEIDRKDAFLPTRVGRGATIGANATIVCGHDLGAYCFIAAGSVVTGDVPPHALMAGVPARQIGWVSHAGERLDKDLICPREGRKYRVVDGAHLEEILP
ncbi:MAG: Gfo/Idh/MocA family oxidoreductase [Rhodospirillales bacterium]